MMYIPTVLSNKWITDNTRDYNQGIHDQKQFKSGVTMLEKAINECSHPKLIHLVLTHGDSESYGVLIKKIKRNANNLYAYKACTEVDSYKGTHVHIMMVIDTPDPRTFLEVIGKYSDTTPVIKICEPQHHAPNAFIPLTLATLQDAADWLSYIFKTRSKPSCHKYMSSRHPARHSRRAACSQ